MYTKQEASRIRQQFWTNFGQYMRPLPNAEGEPVNWLNYKTGIRHLYFRMDADKQQASIAIELRHPDAEERQRYFGQLLSLRSLLKQELGEEWEWQPQVADDDGKWIARIGATIRNVNLFHQPDWPAIISFLKPRLLALDRFWLSVKDGFE